MASIYFTDQDVERFIIATEHKNRNLFCVWLLCSLVCQPVIWYTIFVDNWSKTACYFLGILSTIALVCLFLLGYVYYLIRKLRKSFEQAKNKEQSDISALINEFEH